MSQPPIEQFDDPAFKAAIRRVWGDERAPRDLRERIAAALVDPEPKSIPIRTLWRPAFGLAAAAMVLIAVGLVLRFSTRTTPSASAVAKLPAVLAQDLVQRHDECCSIGDKHHMPGLAEDPNNFVQVRAGLEKRLGMPVLCTNLPADGPWHFDGGSICPVGDTDSGHLVFSKPLDPNHRQFVSVFSLPRTMKEGLTVQHDTAEVDQNHAIVGFVTARCFYCVVGSSTDGSLTLNEVRKLSNDLRSDVALGSERESLALAGSR